METVELGGARLHALRVHPGLPGESQRLANALARLAPARVLIDASTDEVLRLREGGAFAPSFVDALFADESSRRFGKGDPSGEHPIVAAARFARGDLVVLRPAADRPGVFARRRLARTAALLAAPTPEAFAAAFAPLVPPEDAEGAAPRVERALREGRAPVAIVLQAHRADATLARVRALGRIVP